MGAGNSRKTWSSRWSRVSRSVHGCIVAALHSTTAFSYAYPSTGIYFIPTLLKAALADKSQARFFDKSKIMEYFDFGGE